MDVKRGRPISLNSEFDRLLALRYGVSRGDMSREQLEKIPKKFESLGHLDRTLVEIAKLRNWRIRNRS